MSFFTETDPYTGETSKAGTDAEARGYQLQMTNGMALSSLCLLDRRGLFDALHRARAARICAERDHGLRSFEHGAARGRIRAIISVMHNRGIIP